MSKQRNCISAVGMGWKFTFVPFILTGGTPHLAASYTGVVDLIVTKSRTKINDTK